MSQEKRKIVFVCVENARRSQMAEGFAKILGQGKVDVYSAGSHPSGIIDPGVIEVMKERGVDLSSNRSKGLDDLPQVEMDYVVTMGCEETCPAVLAKKMIAWEVPDPKGKPIDEIRLIRDLLEAKVKGLVEGVAS
jgi:protein-tyrosine-phosphatase